MGILLLIYWDICAEAVNLVYALDPKQQRGLSGNGFGDGHSCNFGDVKINSCDVHGISEISFLKNLT